MCAIEIHPGARAALYARVSSDQQAQAQTIASQVEALQERLRQDSMEQDPELYFIDDGYSGATLVRPALERLRDMAALGVIERLYVHSPDRLARKYAYQVLLLEEFHRCGVEVVFLNHAVSDNPEEQLLLQVQGMMAEYERAKIIERHRRGKLHAARHGSVNVLSGAPYGYRYVGARVTGGHAAYEIVLEQARVVRQIFAWVGQDRLSLQEVCRRLQNQGIRTATGKSWWDRATVWGILKNPAYQGRAAYGKTRYGPLRPRLRPQRGHPAQPRRAHSIYEVPAAEQIAIAVPALVEPDLFATVQEQLQENRLRQRERRRGARYLLQGLLVCGTCGHAYYGKPVSLKAGKGKKRSYAYYRCIGSDAYRFGGQRLCWNQQVRTDLLEQVVWQDVCSLLQEPQRIAREQERRLTKNSDDSSLEQLRTLTQKVKRGMGRLIDAYQDGLIDRTQFEPRLHQAQDRLQSLNGQIATLATEQSRLQDLHLVVTQVETFAKMLEGSLEQADWSTKRQVIRTLVKQIEIGPEGVKVVYRIDSLPFVQAPERGVLPHCWWGVSPLLANLFLHYVLDLWWERKVQPTVGGTCVLVRYADDFICMVQHRQDAETLEKLLHERFAKFGLTLHPEKTRTISFGRSERENARREGRRPNTFDFLGFTHYAGRSRKGNFLLGRRTSRKKFRKACQEILTWLQQVRNLRRLSEIWGELAAKLRGHYSYYGVSGNSRMIRNFGYVVIRAVQKWLARRSQRRDFTWKRLNDYLKHYPLPRPRIGYQMYPLLPWWETDRRAGCGKSARPVL
jgi:site-specific DNA recombinase